MNTLKKNLNLFRRNIPGSFRARAVGSGAWREYEVDEQSSPECKQEKNRKKVWSDVDVVVNTKPGRFSVPGIAGYE